MTRMGMDVEVIELLGRKLKVSADQIENIARAIDALVANAVQNWDGPDARRFESWWREQHLPALRTTRDAVDGLGQSALNNAADQRGVSNSAGSVEAGHSSANSTPSVAGPTGTAPTAAPDARPAQAVSDFAKTWRGQYLDYDTSWHNQCFDVFAQYNHAVVGGPDIIAATTGGAKDLYNDYASNGTSAHYDRIPGTERPTPGDVVVWGNGQYGHVGVVTAVAENGYTVLEQNVNAKASETNVGSLPEERSHRFNEPGLLGYLRPKN